MLLKRLLDIALSSLGILVMLPFLPVVSAASRGPRARRKALGARRWGFSGEENVDFYHVRQVVPVDPASRYLLTSDLSTRDITTTNGITLDVYCKGMHESSDTYTGTVGWTKVRIFFDTPRECNSVNVRLRRYKSNKFDNLISGEAWVDNVSLFKLGPAKGA